MPKNVPLELQKTQLIGVMVTKNEHIRFKTEAVKGNTTISDLMLSGVEKEILFRELKRKYETAFVLTSVTSLDTEAIIRQMVEQKEKIAKEFIKRIMF